MFKIEFSDVKNKDDEERAVIHINDFSEDLILPTSYWQRHIYIDHWHEAIQKILNGSEHEISALITEMYDPKKPKYAIMWWPLYRENDKVFIRNGYLSLEEVGITKEPGINELITHVLPRDEKFDSAPSEWCVSLSDLEKFDKYIQTIQV